jgi:hypothetical protein
MAQYFEKVTEQLSDHVSKTQTIIIAHEERLNELYTQVAQLQKIISILGRNDPVLLKLASLYAQPDSQTPMGDANESNK